MPIKVSPSILSANFSNLEKEIKKLNETSCDSIHIDCMDGHFVSNLTFGPKLIADIKPYSKKKFDTHLMIENPSKYIDEYINAGSDIITFHIEAMNNNEDAEKLLKYIKSKSIECGIVLKPKTKIKEIMSIISLCDYILIMSVEPGFGGQKIILETLEKVKELVKIRNKEKLNFQIEIDGGINEETAKLAIKAGCDILISGSFLFKNDNMEEKIKKLRG